jgi:tetraacyldisaccharide 4'-kinase
VAVGEERLYAISQLLHDKPGTEAIILDDAFQHRSIKAGLNIVLTDCNNLFTRDFYLPTGDLRDQKSSYKRAEIIVVTKCNAGLTREGRKKIVKEIQPEANQPVFFTAIEYGAIYHISSKQPYQLTDKTEVLLVTGIANPKPLMTMLEDNCKTFSMQQYPDHHIFRIDDLREIKKRFNEIESHDKIILTTEKDAVRLIKFEREFSDLALYVIPVRHYFLFGEEGKFNELVINFIRDFRQTNK